MGKNKNKSWAATAKSYKNIAHLAPQTFLIDGIRDIIYVK